MLWEFGVFMGGLENPTIIRQGAKKYLIAIFRQFLTMTNETLDPLLFEIADYFGSNIPHDTSFDFNHIWGSMITHYNQHWMNYRHDNETLNLIHYAKLLAQYHFNHILTQNISPNSGGIQKVLEDFFTTHNLNVPTEQETQECLMDLGLYVCSAVFYTIHISPRSQ